VKKNKNVDMNQFFNIFPPFCDFSVSAKKRRAPQPPRPPPVAVHEVPGFLEELMSAYRRIVCKASPTKSQQEDQGPPKEEE
jgi:hypothetical protein